MKKELSQLSFGVTKPDTSIPRGHWPTTLVYLGSSSPVRDST